MHSPLPTCAALVLLTCFVAPAQQPSQAPESSSSSPAPSADPVFWTNPDPNAHAIVLEDTLLRVMTNTPLISGKTRPGSPVVFTLSEDVVINNVLIIPRGATLHGTVVQSKKAGALNGRASDLILKLVSLDLGGRRYPIYTYEFLVEGASKQKPTRNIVGGAKLGALAGAVISAKEGVATESGKLTDVGAAAAAGAAVGTLASAVTPGPAVNLPPESQIDFYLSTPISIVPVTRDEAAALSHKLPHGGPVLYVRGETP